MIVVSDASPLNILVRIGHADTLSQLFGSVVVPPAVASELSHERTPEVVRSWLAAKPDWLRVQSPAHIETTLQLKDAGEIEAISLALELKADLLLADDRKARREAMTRGLSVTGAIGVLESAAARGLIDLRVAFDRLRLTDFKISDDVLIQALKREEIRRKT
jgi:predicted nucleic acid-binding protein